MAEAAEPRVAVYIDFDNIVISRYDQVYGRGKFMADKAKGFPGPKPDAEQEAREQAIRATVDVGAILDFATSFGSVVISRAFADWSVPANSKYARQLVDRAVDLTQLFPTAAYTKNGADIRLSVDVVEDMFRLPDITHVVIVAGDSDFIPLAQRCKRLGRYVVGIGVTGSTSKQLAAACNEFAYYDSLPGVLPEPARQSTRRGSATGNGRTRAATGDTADAVADAAAGSSPAVETGATADAPADATPDTTTAVTASGARARSTMIAFTDGASASVVDSAAGGEPVKKRPRRASSPAREATSIPEPEPVDPLAQATDLLVRAVRLGHAKTDDEWLQSGGVKSQMLRMDPSFNEKSLGFTSFSDFVKSHSSEVEVGKGAPAGRLKLREVPRG